jgi:hypothetical protein
VNLLKSQLRRTTAVAAGSLLGLAAIAVFAAPASAHKPAAEGKPTCVTDEGWAIDWTVRNKFHKADATALSVEATDQDGNKLEVTGDLTAPGTVFNKSGDKVTGGTKVTDADVEKVTLTVVLRWTDRYENKPVTATVQKGDVCEVPENPEPSTSASVPSTPPSEEPEIPTPSLPGEPSLFEPVFDETCDTITVGIDNPADGLEWTLGYRTSKGETREVVVKPGEKKTETFSATEGFSIELTLTVTVEGETVSESTTIAYEQPGDCDGEGGGLPVTGAAAGGIAGGAAALLGVGALLFFMARRRKLKFTA